MQSYLVVIAAGLVPTLLGFAWYHPRLFGAEWVRMMRITPEMAESGQGRRSLFSLVSLIAGFAVALVVYLVCSAWGASDAVHTMGVAALLWAGCMVPTSLGDVLWEQKPIQLYAIDAGYWLISFLIMGAMVGAAIS